VILVRFVNAAGKGAVQQEQRRLSGTAFTLGRSAKCQIQLPDGAVALEHAVIALLSGGATLAASGGVVQVNGQPAQSAPLKPGDRVRIGPFRLQVQAPAPGIDLELVVTRQSRARTRVRRAFLSAFLALPKVSKRRLSYLAFFSTLILFLALPALPDLLRERPLPLSREHAAATREMSMVLAQGMAQSWNPGPVTAGHQVFFENCRACHETPFVQVRDGACLACHDKVRAHVPQAKFTGPLGVAFQQTRCTECHSEHKGQPIVLRAQARCTDCHADVKRVALEAKSLDVTDFRTGHPDFRVTLPDPNDPAGVLRVRLSNPPVPQLVEKSNLKFNHALHLNPGGIRDPEGHRDAAGLKDAQGNRRVLKCADCHLPGDGERLMQPVRMEQHCRSCHSLAFEPKVSKRQVPHGNVEEVSTMLLEFYSRLVLGDVPSGTTPPTDLPRLRPGAAPSYPERQRALEVAQQKAQRVLDELYQERGVCSTCHYVARDAQSGAWTVAKVRINHVWMPQAKFTHRQHDTQSCTTCHEVRFLKKAEDIAMPGIARCRDCHVGEKPQLGKVTSDCAACHGFHFDHAPWPGDRRPKTAVQARAGEP
jgi:hypothetical protein